MMSKRKHAANLVLFVLFITAPCALHADPYIVTVDLSGFAPPLTPPPDDVQLVFDLYDNSGVLGDSRALIDNVVFDSSTIDFASGLNGFVDIGGGGVSVVSQQMQLAEDIGAFPTSASRDYLATAATSKTLQFQFEWFSTGAGGTFGTDELVVSLFDADPGAAPFTPLDPGLMGLGDILSVSGASGNLTIKKMDYVDLTVVPVPGSMLLGGLGMASAALIRRIRRRVA
jgi:hypothetical protein